MPVQNREALLDFEEHGTAFVTAKVKHWYVIKEAFVFSYKISQMPEPSPLAALAYHVVSNQYDKALSESSVPSLLRDDISPDEDVTVSMPNILFLAVFSALDKVAWWAESEVTPENMAVEDRAGSIVDGADHLLETYRVFQPQAAAITKTYAVA